MKKNEYGLFTTIAMIVGVVIGSGIFFKSDNILVATNGNIFWGVVVFSIAALSIIFGSLTIAELAARNSEAGGIITYAEDSCNKHIACAFGWFHTFLYYPTLLAVVSWVTGIYTCILFGVKGNLEIQTAIGVVIVLIIFACNVLSGKLGGYFQNISTIIKIIPLMLIAIAGLFLGNPGEIISNAGTGIKSIGWISAIAPVAFSFDGWIVATTMGHEIKNSKKNLPIALIIAPLFILGIYILYFVGISVYVGPETVMSLGDAHVDLAANKLLGPWGSKIILIFVIISIMGTVNGIIMGLTRLPYSLAIRNMFPRSHKVKEINEKLGMPIISSFVALALGMFWIIVHYLTQKYKLLPNSDISEISITINYVAYIVLYIQVFRYGLKGEIKGIWRAKINPILAILGSMLILSGSISNPLFLIYTFICSLIIVGAMLFWNKRKNCICLNLEQ